MAASSAEHPVVAAITVSYGSGDVLSALLASVQRASRRPTQIIVVDNLAETEVESIAKDYGASYLPRPDNPGYGGAVNAAVESLLCDSVEWILVVNPDVILGEGSIDELVREAAVSANIGAIGPAILTGEGAIYPSARRVPSLRTGVGHALFANAWPRNPWSRRYRQDHNPLARDAGWLSGACVIVNRQAFEQIGGFDAGYFMYFEDVDLGMRLAQRGWRNRYEPSTKVTHTGAHSTDSRRREMTQAHHRSARRFLAKKYPGARWLLVRLILGVGLRVRAALTRAQPRRVTSRSRYVP